MSARFTALPDCAAPPRATALDRSLAGVRLPEDACDTHAHVFGPPWRYPLDVRRNYTPHVCTLEQYREHMRALGIERAVFVQPSVYGTDNSAMLDALRAGGAAFRGIAVPSADISDSELNAMHELGVRGIRLNLANPQVLDVDAALAIVWRVAPLGWHLQVHLKLAESGIAPLQSLASRVAVPIVIDHMGRVDPQDVPDGLLGLLHDGRCWVKLSAPYRLDSREPDFADLRPLVDKLVSAAPTQTLWATDWPHTELPDTTPGSTDLLNWLVDWLPDPELRKQVCVTNPANLYFS
jgi:predicted TIM-barrel fold metal-dependent hydrolase